jgi:hypothetical protein
MRDYGFDFVIELLVDAMKDLNYAQWIEWKFESGLSLVVELTKYFHRICVGGFFSYGIYLLLKDLTLLVTSCSEGIAKANLALNTKWVKTSPFGVTRQI